MKSVERFTRAVKEKEGVPDVILSCAAEIYCGDPEGTNPDLSADGYDATFATNALVRRSEERKDEMGAECGAIQRTLSVDNDEDNCHFISPI
jgi:hypothetical protein